MRNPIAARGSPAPLVRVDRIAAAATGCIESSVRVANGQRAINGRQGHPGYPF